ncbi:MAG: hypothetical protein V1799_11885 [bacterium]
MPYQPGQGKTAVALFVDGLELQFVQLSLKANKVTLRDYKTVALAQKFEEKHHGEEGGGGSDDFGSTESYTEPAISSETPGEEAHSNASVLLSLLTDLPSSKYELSFALSEPAITYQEFDSDASLKGTKLKKHIAQELAAMRASPPALDALDLIPTASGGLLSVVREDGLQLFDLLTEIKPFIGNRLPLIHLIDSSDLDLIGLVRGNYEIQDEEVTVIIYVGNEFSRLIFMQGKDYMHFAPIISEGYSSSNIENTIYSRVLLEQDNIALTRIDRILLCGESHKVNLREALAPQFSSAAVDYLQLPGLDLSQFQDVGGEPVSEYAIPIAAAWKSLQPKHPGFYAVNLCPISILEGQKAFKLAWHGWLLLPLLMGSIVFFLVSIKSRNEEIASLSRQLENKKTQIEDLNRLREQKEFLTKEINRFRDAATLYDSLAPGSDRWSRVLHYLANSVEDLSPLWVSKIARDDNPAYLRITGRSVYRNRISRFANVFERATLKSVKPVSVRGKTLYEFELIVEKIDKGQERRPSP